MNEDAHAALVLVLGGVAVRLAVSDAHLAYVKPSMRPLLLGAGAILALLGAGFLLRRDGWVMRGSARDAAAERAGHDAAGDHHAPAVGWLLLLPILAITFVAPDPLGAFAAGRVPEREAAPPASFGPLPAPRDGAVDLTLSEFRARALHDDARSLADVPVRLVGFVVPGADGLTIARFVLSCCAADAAPVRVVVRNVDAPYPAVDTWIEVTGSWRPRPPEPDRPRPPELDVRSLRVVPEPAQPYED